MHFLITFAIRYTKTTHFKEGAVKGAVAGAVVGGVGTVVLAYTGYIAGATISVMLGGISVPVLVIGVVGGMIEETISKICAN